MTKELMRQLSKMDGADFELLEWHMWTARQVRNMITKEGLSDERVCEILNIHKNKLKSVLNGGYEYDLRMISRIQSHQQEKASDDAKFKIEAESIQFTTYKDQYPLYVSKIEKLLSILEKQYPEQS